MLASMHGARRLHSCVCLAGELDFTTPMPPARAHRRRSDHCQHWYAELEPCAEDPDHHHHNNNIYDNNCNHATTAVANIDLDNLCDVSTHPELSRLGFDVIAQGRQCQGGDSNRIRAGFISDQVLTERFGLSLVDCLDACVLNLNCTAVFAWQSTSTTPNRCRLLQPDEDDVAVTGTGTRSLSFLQTSTLIPVIGTATTGLLNKYWLMAVGQQAAPTGLARPGVTVQTGQRFRAGFGSSSDRIASTTVSLDECLLACVSNEDCRGMFIWRVAGDEAVRCVQLSDTTGEGFDLVNTGTNSISMFKI
eukprot:TRINITY_DN12477_c1_g3_i3.p1 TRINITY_DN12477_c1_g3~~TRINITY_DN12477_c1_g3_i3.p1  ORF type:complete len:305 (+),score=66.38 TRINITY_DN12477_c1_g3_i3:391-1305(+)